MGLTCMGMACFHIANFQSELRIPRMCPRFFGASGRDFSHISTGRACGSLVRLCRPFGKMWTRIRDPYLRTRLVRGSTKGPEVMPRETRRTLIEVVHFPSYCSHPKV